MNKISTLLCGIAFFILSESQAQQTFTSAKISIDYKTSLDSATLLIRDGRIVDIGKGLTIPAEAVVFDLKGKLIYPSLIDIFTDYGIPEVKRPGGGDGSPQFLSNTKGAYGWNQAIRAEYDAYRNFSVEPKKAEEWRKLGFGTVMSVCDRAAANFSFDKGSSTQDYPSSLMGSIALLRQTYYDSQWYTNGGYKLEYNISLDAFSKLHNLPKIFDAGDKQNELRADKIGEEFGVNYILKGNGDEYERINGNSFIVPLNFPDAYDLSDPYDALAISYRQMKQWELAPGNPAALEKAGVNFALTASDLKNKADLWKNIRKAIDNGLSPQQALKSLTQIPAELLGLSDQVGALKKGMLANFIITSRSLFEKENLILENWVKGIRYQISDYSGADIRGNYTLTIGTLSPMRLKIGGEMLSPEASVFEDTTSIKVILSRIGNQMNIQFELKKKETKGIYRLGGSSDESSVKQITGNAQLPGGEWVNWSARMDSAFVQVVKRDTTKKDTTAPGPLTFPNCAYGWKELPKPLTTLFTNTTVWTNESEGILQNADVLIVDGKISQVGKKISPPAGAQVIDGSGMHLTSGIIDEHSHIAVSDAVNEATQSSSAEVRIGDVVDADDIQIYRQLAGGVTCSHLLHGSANAIGGQTQLIKLRWGQSPEGLKFSGWPGFIKFALGENVKQANWGDRQVSRFP